MFFYTAVRSKAMLLFRLSMDLREAVRGRTRSQQPPADGFADTLANLFCGPLEDPVPPDFLSERPFNLEEIRKGIERMRRNRSADECGLVAELLQHIPLDFQTALLDLYNGVLQTGELPSSWRHTLFVMLAKTPSAKDVTDFRPIANIRLLYKLFAYIILGRMEAVLDQ